MCRPQSSIQSTINTADIFTPAYIEGNLNTLAPKEQSTTPSKKSTDKTKTLLPIDFEPSEYSVICGNKKVFFNSVGNRRFRVICQMHLAEFMNAPSKHEKSFVVTQVMKKLKEACPVGTFVAFEKGRWWQVSERTSREKVGTFFRDCLADSYKSSSKNKIAQRRMKRTNNGSCPSPIPSICASPVPSMAISEAPFSSPITSVKPVVAPITPPTSPMPAARNPSAIFPLPFLPLEEEILVSDRILTRKSILLLNDLDMPTAIINEPSKPETTRQSFLLLEGDQGLFDDEDLNTLFAL